MNISPTITIWISPHDIPIMVGYCWWNSHFCFWTPLIDTVKYRIASYIPTISQLYTSWFFLNVGSAIFVHWSRANTLMVQRSFLPAEDWRTSTMILLLKTTFLLIEKTKNFLLPQSSCLNHIFPYFSQFLWQNLGNHPNFAGVFSLHSLPPDSHLGSDSIGNGSGGWEHWEIFGSIYGCFVGEISFFLLILGTIFRHRTLPDGFNPYENFTNRTCG